MLDKSARVECCTNNVSMDEWAALRESEIEVDQQYCLQRCGVCHDSPFVVVDGETVRGESYDELLTASQTAKPKQ